MVSSKSISDATDTKDDISKSISDATETKDDISKLNLTDQIKIISNQDTTEDTHNVQNFVTPNSQEIFTTGNSNKGSANDRASQRNEIMILSEDQKDAPLSEIYKEEHTIENEMDRNPKDFLIKRKVHTSNNRYFCNNAHIYQMESDKRSKGIKTVKQHTHYMQAIQQNAEK